MIIQGELINWRGPLFQILLAESCAQNIGWVNINILLLLSLLILGRCWGKEFQA